MRKKVSDQEPRRRGRPATTVEEDGKPTLVQCTVPGPAALRLKRVAAAEGLKPGLWVRKLILSALVDERVVDEENVLADVVARLDRLRVGKRAPTVRAIVAYYGLEEEER